MWRLVGVNSKEIYSECEYKSDLNKWFLKTYTKDTGHKDGVHVDMPEPMRYVRVGDCLGKVRKEGVLK